MARPLHLPSFFEEEDFKVLYKKYGQKKYGIRILALYYLQIGKSITEVSKLICKAAYTIRDWIKRYKEGGLQSLLSIRVGRGRSGKLSQANAKALIQEINVWSKSLSGGRLRALDIKSLIQEKFNVSYALSGVYALLHRLGYSWITSRSVHPKANKALQESFKK